MAQRIGPPPKRSKCRTAKSTESDRTWKTSLASTDAQGHFPGLDLSALRRNYMKRRLGYCLAAAVFVVGILCMASGLAAQEEPAQPIKSKQQAVPKGGPAPRTADGHPDFSGVWFGGTAGGFTYNPGLRRQFDAKAEE